MTISVIYLAYYNENAGYGLNVIKDFINSYKNHPAGIKHSLKFIAKNWTDINAAKEFLKLAKEVNAEVIELPDDGWDLGAYFRASETIKSDYLFFLGSSSKILADNWLLHFYNAFKNDKKVKIAGPMGSWEDPKKNFFPNFHIRTCSFMIDRKIFLEYKKITKFPETKIDTYQIEHGDNSLSQYILKKGFNAVVVDSDGKVFNPEEWPTSATYNTLSNEKLLISDKNAERFHEHGKNVRQYTEFHTWGQVLTDREYKAFEKIPNIHRTELDIFISSVRNLPIFQSRFYHPIFNGKPNFELPCCSYVDYYDENISSKNYHYGDLTGQYWIWENLLPKNDTEYIGFCKDTLFLNLTPDHDVKEEIIPVLTETFYKAFHLEIAKYNLAESVKDYDFVFPHKTVLKTDVMQFFEGKFDKKYLDLTLITLKNLYPEYQKTVENVLTSNSMYSNECFVMKRELFTSYMEWLFSILNTVEKEIKWGVNEKIVLYLAQILLNIWVEYNVEKSNLKISMKPTYKLFDDANDYISNFLEEHNLSGLTQSTAPANVSKVESPDSRVKIFASYYRPAPLIESNVFQPIFNGASGHAEGLDVLRDDNGINISKKNINYGELTQQYWVWKNYMPEAENEYVGFCQYHRFLDFELTPNLNKEAYQPILALNFPAQEMLQKYTEENIYNYIKDYDIILPTKITFGTNIYSQYVNNHKHQDIDVALQVLAEIYPDYIKTAQEVLSTEEMYIYGSFIMKKELINEYMDWIFNILFMFEKRCDWSSYDEYNRRVAAFIAERFFNVWLDYNVKTKGLKVKNTTSYLLCENMDLYLREVLYMTERLKVKINKNVNEDPEPSEPQVKIFSIYYKPAPVFKSEVYQPIYNGAANFALPAGALTDDTGINISSKNPHYGELTQNYWVWKNYMPTSTAKYIGFCHYRRFLDFNMSKINSDPLFPIFINNFPQMFEQYTEENIMKVIDGYDIVLPNKFHFPTSLYDQYLMWHPKKDLDLALEVLNELYPEYNETAQEFLKSKSMHICFNYVMKKELVNEFFEWIFNILTELEKRCDWSQYTEYFYIRIPAFIAERFFNIWLDYNVKKRNLKVLNSTNILISYDFKEYTDKCLEKIEKLKAQLELNTSK